jgi:hypothetical protein
MANENWPSPLGPRVLPRLVSLRASLSMGFYPSSRTGAVKVGDFPRMPCARPWSISKLPQVFTLARREHCWIPETGAIV